MKLYEHTLIAKQDLSSSKLGDLREKYKKIIDDSSGKVVKIEDWGLLNFAKKIKRYNKGFYIHYKFEGAPKTIEEIKRNILIDNSVLNHLTVIMKKLDLDTEYFKKDK
jgi:small subunit ribosomal protein S6